ncbi:DUF502 domain-containing protein [Candidatus Omnitrophota bacterium]
MGRGYRTFTTAVRNYFLAGLAVWLPIAITYYAATAILKFADGLMGKLARRYFIEEFGYYIPGFGILAAIAFLILTGFIATRFIGRRIMPVIESILHKIPLINSIYTPAKQVADFVFSKEKLGLRKVVLAEYPSKGIYQLGFITQDRIEEINSKSRSELLGVLIPNTPYPLSGFLVFLPKDRVIMLDMTIEESMKLLISGGVVRPNYYLPRHGK